MGVESDPYLNDHIDRSNHMSSTIFNAIKELPSTTVTFTRVAVERSPSLAHCSLARIRPRPPDTVAQVLVYAWNQLLIEKHHPQHPDGGADGPMCYTL